MDMIKQIKKQNIAIMGNKDWVYIGGVLCYGKWTVSDTVQTACTDGKNVWYGSEFCSKLSEPELRFIILHEAMHKMARHLSVYKSIHKLDGQRANAACDYWINGELIKQDNGSKFLKMISGGLYNPKYYGKTVIDIFKDLEGQESDKQQDGGKDEQGNETTEGYPSKGGMDEHDWDSLSEEEKESLAKDIEIAIRQGKALAGKMDGNKPRLIDDVLAGKVDWRTELAEFLKATMAGRDESSWSSLNRRMFHMGHFPSSISTACGRLCIAPDMSGSIYGEVLARFMGEIKKLCLELRPAGVDIVWWDTQVCSVQSFEPSQYEALDTLLKPAGGGGTLVECVFDWIDTARLNHEVVVVLTDGYTPYPTTEYKIPVLWAMISDVVAPWGRTLHIEEFE